MPSQKPCAEYPIAPLAQCISSSPPHVHVLGDGSFHGVPSVQELYYTTPLGAIIGTNDDLATCAIWLDKNARDLLWSLATRQERRFSA